MSFIAKKSLRILPLVIAFLIWLIGYLYTYKLTELGLCALNSYDCPPLMDDFGFPFEKFSLWFLPSAIIATLTPLKFLKRWISFLIVYLIIAFIVVNSESRDSLVGKENMAMALGALLIVITIVWLVIYLILNRKRS